MSFFACVRREARSCETEKFGYQESKSRAFYLVEFMRGLRISDWAYCMTYTCQAPRTCEMKEVFATLLD